MRVLHVMAGASAGGAETAYAELVTAQHDAGFDIAAACRPSLRNAAMRVAGVPLYELPFGGFFDFSTKRGLKRIIDAHNPSVCVTWMNRAAQKLPRNTKAKWIARLGGYYDLKYYRGVDHFVVNAPDIARWMTEHGVDPGRITFIPNFAEVPPHATPVPRATLDTPDDAFVFLTLARLHPNKAIDTLLRAMVDVPNAYLWIGGDGPERASLEALATDLNLNDRIRFLGWRDDRWNLLAGCDAFVLPSRHEPFGNSFMQAWAAGRALVTTASQGPAHFARDGETALITPIDDVPALAAALCRVRDDTELRRVLAANALGAYAQAFDRARILQQWQSLFDHFA